MIASKGALLRGLGTARPAQSTLTHLLEEPLQSGGGARPSYGRRFWQMTSVTAQRKPYQYCGFSYAYVPVTKFDVQIRGSKRSEPGSRARKNQVWGSGVKRWPDCGRESGNLGMLDPEVSLFARRAYLLALVEGRPTVRALRGGGGIGKRS